MPLIPGPRWTWTVFDAAFFLFALALVTAAALFLLVLVVGTASVTVGGFDRSSFNGGGLVYFVLPASVAYVGGLAAYAVYAGVGQAVGRPEPSPVWLVVQTRRLLWAYPPLIALLFVTGAVLRATAYR